MGHKVEVVETFVHIVNGKGCHVCKGELILMPVEHRDYNTTLLQLGDQIYEPLIISKTEQVVVEDLAYDIVYKKVFHVTEIKKQDTRGVDGDITKYAKTKDLRKVLSSCHNISYTYLDVISIGQLKSGAEVFVECEDCIVDYVTKTWSPKGYYIGKQVKLIDNYVQLFYDETKK